MTLLPWTLARIQTSWTSAQPPASPGSIAMLRRVPGSRGLRPRCRVGPVRVDGAEAGGGEGRHAVLGQVGVYGQQAQRVRLDVLLLEGLERAQASGERARGIQRGQGPAAAVGQPPVDFGFQRDAADHL
ncbi:hypothetical protein [Streptomyces sp. NPDC056387]|uniref:hypothetical protein n=1 Tax=Streptomyces sp. NPDC056387 TaxID=3345803 RepID=UPI0035D73B2E